MTIVIPHYTRRAWQTSFWLVMSLGVGVLAGVLLWRLRLPQRMAVASAIAVAAAIPGLLRPQIAVLPMRIWNRLGRLFARGATVWITGVSFYVVFTVVGRTVSSLRLTPPVAGGSLWSPWPADANGKSDKQQGILTAKLSKNGWISDFTAWARRSNNLWAWGLLPFLLILSTLETTGDVEAPPAGIYTLY